jgi:hypothetical protein
MNKHIKIVMLMVCSLMIVFLLTDYNIMKYTLLNDVVLITLSICWIKSYELVSHSFE